MKAITYEATRTREGAMLCKRGKGGIVNLPTFSHGLTGHSLPWDWMGGWYSQWMCAYAVLLDASEGGEQIALRLAAPFVRVLLARAKVAGWTFEASEVRAWIVEQVNRSVADDSPK